MGVEIETASKETIDPRENVFNEKSSPTKNHEKQIPTTQMSLWRNETSLGTLQRGGARAVLEETVQETTVVTRVAPRVEEGLVLETAEATRAGEDLALGVAREETRGEARVVVVWVASEK